MILKDLLDQVFTECKKFDFDFKNCEINRTPDGCARIWNWLGTLTNVTAEKVWIVGDALKEKGYPVTLTPYVNLRYLKCLMTTRRSRSNIVKAKQGQPAHYLCLEVDLPEVVEFAPAYLLKQIRKVLRNGEWRNGLEGFEVGAVYWSRNGRARKSESNKYTVGERVLAGTKALATEGKYKYYFVTSYRTAANMGMFRLMRNDGVLSSRAAITKLIEAHTQAHS